MFGALGLGLPALGSGGLGGLPQTPVVLGALQYLHPAFPLTRPSAKWGFSGGNLVGFGNNVPAWVDAPGGGYGLSVEQQATNQIQNPRLEGAATGTPGTWPTGMSVFISGTGTFTTSINSLQTVNGYPTLDFTVSGTSTSTGFANIALGPSFAAANGQTWAETIFAALISGAFPTRTGATGMALLGALNSAAPAYLSEFSASPGRLTSGATMQPLVSVGTISAPTVATLVPYLQIPWDSGQTFSVRVRIGLPQCEQGAYPTSPILPAIGTPAATTRAGDQVLSTALASLIPDIANWAIMTEFVVSGAAAAATYPATFNVGDAANATRFTAYTNAGTRARAFAAAGGTGGFTIGTYADGVIRKEILGVTGGTMRGSVNGGAVASSAYTLNTSAIDRVVLGAITSGGGHSLNGIICRQILYPACPSDAAMQALSA